jgi:NAD(P)-dependent dehydrogenase (short-subunit alcohol dehydrogenase family)
MDVDSDSSVADALTRILRQRGRIDVLVNNAGIGGLGAVEDTPLSTYRQVMETNYFGTLRCIQAVLPSMRAGRSGAIVNVTSVAGRVASAGQSSYCASKFAVEALSESLAGEVKGFGIRVAIVEPGVIATPIFVKQPVGAESLYPPPAAVARAVRRVTRTSGTAVGRR